MAGYKRKRTGAARPAKKRKFNMTRKKMGRRRLGGMTQVHHFRRMFANTGTIVGNAVYNPYLDIFGPVTLSQVQGASDFTNLFDQYRLNFCVVKFYLKISPDAQTAANASFPKLYWHRDYDDSNVPLSIAEMRENGRTKVAVMHPNRPVTIKFKPNCLGVLYQSAIANQYTPKFKQWLDMSNAQTPHYGFKYAIDDLTNTNYRVTQEIYLYFSCKNTR